MKVNQLENSLTSFPLPSLPSESGEQPKVVTQVLDINRLSLPERKRTLRTLATVYAKVFQGEPWNENTKCPTTGTYYGMETRAGRSCSCCGKPLESAYPLRKTMSDIQKELQKPNAVCVLAKSGEETVGFSWGYTYPSSDAFVNEKYTNKKVRSRIKNLLKRVGIDGEFFYLSESGVLPEYRNQGLASRFWTTRMEVAKHLKLPVVVRTNYQSPIVDIAKRFGMTQIMGPQKRELRRLPIINFTDQQNKSRVLLAIGR